MEHLRWKRLPFLSLYLATRSIRKTCDQVKRNFPNGSTARIDEWKPREIEWWPQSEHMKSDTKDRENGRNRERARNERDGTLRWLRRIESNEEQLNSNRNKFINPLRDVIVCLDQDYYESRRKLGWQAEYFLFCHSGAVCGLHLQRFWIKNELMAHLCVIVIYLFEWPYITRIVVHSISMPSIRQHMAGNVWEKCAPNIRRPNGANVFNWIEQRTVFLVCSVNLAFAVGKRAFWRARVFIHLRTLVR